VGAVVSGTPTPSGDKTTADSNGAFTLYLDPASYRIDFVADPTLPWSSTFVQLDGTSNPLVLPQQVLSNGRQVMGTVTLAATNGASAAPAANAQVYYYRKVQNLGGLTHLPLGQTFTDAKGRYSVTIPTR
jgi:hypothetical protein